VGLERGTERSDLGVGQEVGRNPPGHSHDGELHVGRHPVAAEDLRDAPLLVPELGREGVLAPLVLDEPTKDRTPPLLNRGVVGRVSVRSFAARLCLFARLAFDDPLHFLGCHSRCGTTHRFVKPQFSRKE